MLRTIFGSVAFLISSLVIADEKSDDKFVGEWKSRTTGFEQLLIISKENGQYQVKGSWLKKDAVAANFTGGNVKFEGGTISFTHNLDKKLGATIQGGESVKIQLKGDKLHLQESLGKHRAIRDFTRIDADKTPEPKKTVAKKARSIDPVASDDPNRLMHARGYVNFIRFTADGKTLVTNAGDGVVRFWDFEQRKQRSSFALEGGSCLAITPDASLVAVGFRGQAYVYDALGKQIAEVDGHPLGVTGAAFTPDGKKLLTSDIGKTTSGQPDGITKVTNIADGNKVVAVPLEASRTILASPDGKYFAGVMFEYVNSMGVHFVHIYDMNGKQLHKVRTNNSISSMSYSRDGKRILVACQLGIINVIDTATGKIVHTLKNKAFDYIRATAFFNDGKRFIVGGSGGKASIYDTGSGKLLADLSIHSKEIATVTISRDDKWILAGGGDDHAVTVTPVTASK